MHLENVSHVDISLYLLLLIQTLGFHDSILSVVPVVTCDRRCLLRHLLHVVRCYKLALRQHLALVVVHVHIATVALNQPHSAVRNTHLVTMALVRLILWVVHCPTYWLWHLLQRLYWLTPLQPTLVLFLQVYLLVLFASLGWPALRGLFSVWNTGLIQLLLLALRLISVSSSSHASSSHLALDIAHIRCGASLVRSLVLQRLIGSSLVTTSLCHRGCHSMCISDLELWLQVYLELLLLTSLRVVVLLMLLLLSLMLFLLFSLFLYTVYLFRVVSVLVWLLLLLLLFLIPWTVSSLYHLSNIFQGIIHLIAWLSHQLIPTLLTLLLTSLLGLFPQYKPRMKVICLILQNVLVVHSLQILQGQLQVFALLCRQT